MNIVTMRDVEKSYGTRVLFTGVNVSITSDSRLGLIGVNGTGKSTFLRLLAGQDSPDKGIIERNGKASVYYMSQQPFIEADATLLENVLLGEHPLLKLVRSFEAEGRRDTTSDRYMNLLNRMDTEGGWQVEQEAKIILDELGFQNVNQLAGQLSGGQKRRIALGQALLYPCDLLLLDEPTNHLDESGIAWLESYLQNRKGGLLVSTHDRYFLNAVCNGILELDRKHFYTYSGTYEDFLSLKADREERQASMEEKRRQFLKRELVWVRRGAQARSTKQKARLQRFEALQKQEKLAKVNTLDPIALKSRLGKMIFDIEDLSFAYDKEKPIISHFTYHVCRHDRIGIVGPNGIGKSTFLKLLDGKLSPTGGSVGCGETVKIAHFTQEVPSVDPSMRVLDYIKEDHPYLPLGDGITASAGQMLERFLFPRERQGVLLSKLSGGERRRLYLLRLLMGAPNVLLLDEPTNDLDIPTLEVLEDFLDSFGGVVITVCHDRYFLDRVVDKLFVFEGQGQVKIVHGAYSEYKETLDGPSLEKTKSKERSAKDTSQQEERRSLDKGKEKKTLTLAEEEEYKNLEEKISELESLMKAYDAMLNQVAADYSQMEETIKDRTKTADELDRAMERWMELAERKE